MSVIDPAERARAIVRDRLRESAANGWTIDVRMVATWLASGLARAPYPLELQAGRAEYFRRAAR